MQRTPTLLVLAVIVVAAGAARPKPPVRRAAPPARWDKTVAALFADDAFTLLEGERPADFGRPVPPAAAGTPAPDAVGSGDAVASGDFDRSDMMKKLKAAEETLAEILSGDKTFETGGARAGQAADLVAMMGRTLFSGDPDFGDEDDYLKFAEDMMSAAKQLKILVTKRDYAGARACFDKVKKSCDGCHEGYR